MGRRRKCRFVAEPPAITVFKPVGVPMNLVRGVVVGLDGLEALRLVDAEDFSQEEAAARMGVSRPTLCRTLALARKQVARALSRGWAIRIEVNQDEVVHDTSATGCTRSARCTVLTSAQGGISCSDEDKVDEAAMDKVDPAPMAASRATDRTQDVDAGDNAEQA